MNRLRSLLVIALGGLTSFAVTDVARSAEEYERFLSGLKGRGYYDAAVDYLDSMRNSPLLTADQQMMIPFEEARTYLEASRVERDNVKREQMLDGASAKFKEFAERNSAHPLAAGAATQLGAVLVERGRAKLEQGLSPQNSANRKTLMEEARKFFDEAEKVFVEAEQKFEEKLATYPKFMAPNDPRVAERETVKGELIQAHMFHAYGLYEKSRTYDPADKNEVKAWETALQTAADKYGAIYKDYRTLIAGLAARLKEGQCYQELKNPKRALGLYADLLGQPDLPALRPYKASAMYLSLQCWTMESESMYELAYRQGDEFIKGSTTAELQNPEWLAVRYFTAVAHKLRYEQIPEKPEGEEVAEKQRCFDTAKQYAEIVAATPGEYQSPARGLLKELLGNSARTDAEPRSFAEAKTRGEDSMNVYNTTAAEVKKMAVELKAITDPAAKKAAEDAMAAKSAEAVAARDKAVDFFDLAIKLKDVNTQLEEVNTVRYYLCYLAWEKNQRYDAAVIGEFLLKHYPNSGGARQSAQVALAAYVMEYQDIKNSKGEAAAAFERGKMEEIAGKIVERWAGQPEADTAWNILLQIALAEKDKAEILRAVSSIQPSSPLLPEAEMRSGRVLWGMYQEQLGLDENAPGKLSAAETQELAVEANRILEQTIERQRASTPAIEAMSLLQAETQQFLCESRIALGQFQKALEGLEDPQIGLLPLVRARDKNPNATAGSVPLEAYKLALQAYVLNDQVEKAQQLIPELDALSAGGADTAVQLANTYLNLALRLARQIDQLREAGNFTALKQAAKGFSFFLQQVENSGEAFGQDKMFQNLNWVSDNYFRLGNDLLSQTGVTSEDRALANEYFSKSSALDDKIAPLTQDGSDAQLIVKLRKARSLRRAEKYDDAVNSLREVLVGRRNLMEAQIEACETLMEKAAKDQPDVYALAVNGTAPAENGENVIWGWARIAKTMQSSPYFPEPIAPMQPEPGAAQDVVDQYMKDLAKYNEELALHKSFMRIFHMGRYNMIYCNYQQAMGQSVKEQRDKFLNAAMYALSITQRYTPELGGEEWQPKYEDMRSKIESALAK